MDNEIKYDGFYKDFLDGKVTMTTIDSVFSNTDCLFCEFNDIITPTWLAIISHLLRARPKAVEEFLDLNKVSYLSGNDLIRWYATRKHRNALIDLKKDDIPDTIVDSIANDLFETRYAYYNYEDKPFIMNYAYTLTKTIRTASIIIKKFVIYVEQCNKEVDDFITTLYGNNVDIRSGDLVAALSDIPNNSTFVLSDIHKVEAMIKAGKLQGSSIILADGYGYNYKSTPGVDEDLVVDVMSMMEHIPFKFNTFNNFTD